MAMRSSNRERIARRALEAALAAKEKEAPKPPKAAGKAKRAAVPKRMKFVWKVFNDSFKEMACFPYPEEAQAKAKAAQLTQKTGKEHFVNSVKVPMADGE
jgi:hypothetical protein